MSKRVDYKDEYTTEEYLDLINYHDYKTLVKDFKVDKIKKPTPTKPKKEVSHD